MIKVIHFIHGLSMGGAETLVKDYCIGLDKSKFDVVLLCSIKYGCPYEKILEDAGIRVVYINDYTKGKPKNLLKKALIRHKRYKFVKEFFKNEKADIIHVHLGLLSYIKYSRIDCTVFYTVHGTPDFVWNHNKQEEAAAKYLASHGKIHFITLHENMRKDVNERFGISDSLVLNNGIDFARFNVEVDRSAVRQELGIPEQAFVVGHVGRFRAEKNHDFLIKVFENIAKENENAFLLMIGDGELKNEIKERLNSLDLINQYVILSNRTDIPELMKLMDVFVFPSIFEGLGIVLIEAQKSGLKCIASTDVPDAVKISNLLEFKSLDLPPKEWAKSALNFDISNIEYYGIENWDMKSVIKKLEGFYEECEK